MRSAQVLLALLADLAAGPVTIAEWARTRGIPRRTAYRHLAELREAGLAVTDGRGGWVATIPPWSVS